MLDFLESLISFIVIAMNRGSICKIRILGKPVSFSLSECFSAWMAVPGETLNSEPVSEPLNLVWGSRIFISNEFWMMLKPQSQHYNLKHCIRNIRAGEGGVQSFLIGSQSEGPLSNLSAPCLA